MNASELIHVYVRGVIKKVVEWFNEIYTFKSMITYGTITLRSLFLTAGRSTTSSFLSNF